MSQSLPPAATDIDAHPYDASPYARLVLNLGRALLHAGSPAHRLEAAMQVMAERLGLTAEFFSTPTALIVSLGDGSRQQTYLARVEPGSADLGRLADLTDVMEGLAEGRLDPEAADARVREIDAAPRLYRGPRRFLAYILVSAGICTLIGGGWREMLLAGALGGVTGAAIMLLGSRLDLSRLLTPVTAALVTFAGTLWCGFDPQTALMPAVIAGLISLLPGMDLTISARELATGHLVSGSSRLAGTAMIFALLAFGMALGGSLGRLVTGPVDLAAASSLPGWLLALGFLMAAVGFSHTFQAHRRDWFWILVSCLIAWGGATVGSLTGAPIQGAFLGGLAVGLAGNVFVRATRRPGSIMHLPGLILLVPGSIGMRSLASLLGDEVLPGLETAFLAIMIAVALTTGMILASVLIPPRNEL